MFKRFYLSLVALLGLCGAVAVGNYTMTQGAGTTFGSIVVGGTVHYAQQFICDYVTPSQCANVSAAGAVSVEVANTNTNGQATMANSSPVVIASNQSAVPVSQSGTWTVQPGNTANTTPWLTNNSSADPCQTIANSTSRGSIAAATTVRIIAPSASNKTYICSVDLLAFAANNVAVVEGTGGTCGSGTAGVIGGTTTATGISFAAQGGLVKGGAGLFVWNTAGTNVDFCLITSTTGPLSYFVKYVQAP